MTVSLSHLAKNDTLVQHIDIDIDISCQHAQLICTRGLASCSFPYHARMIVTCRACCRRYRYRAAQELSTRRPSRDRRVRLRPSRRVTP